ncbi:hypothetical protein GCM10029978_094220 [Actinoallomurus acanthiterrae]
MALAAARADLRDDRQDEVLGGHAVRQLAVDRDGHHLRLALWQRLGGEDVLDLARADAERQRPERSVRGGVRVAADDRHARLGQAQLRADDVHDALTGVAHRVQADAELRAVLAQRLDLGARHRVGDRLEDVGGRDVVVLGGDRQVRAPDRTVRHAQAVEGLRAGDLVDEVEIDVEDVRLALGAPYDVRVVNLVRQCSAHHSTSSGSLTPLLTTCISDCETAVSKHGQL